MINYNKWYINFGDSSMKKNLFLLFIVFLCLFIFTGCKKDEKIWFTENKDYFIRRNVNGRYLNITKRGYYIDTVKQFNTSYFYIICMGEKSTGGYGLSVKEVTKTGDKTEIIVEEVVPAKGSKVTMAFTYPTIIVEFPKYQKNIVIKNTEGEIFTELKDY